MLLSINKKKIVIAENNIILFDRNMPSVAFKKYTIKVAPIKNIPVGLVRHNNNNHNET